MQVTALCASGTQAHLMQQPELDNPAFPVTLFIVLTWQKNEQNVNLSKPSSSYYRKETRMELKQHLLG